MNRKEYQERCKHYSPYSGQCYKKSFISGIANNVHVNMRCDGKCPRMRNYDKRNGVLSDKENNHGNSRTDN